MYIPVLIFFARLDLEQKSSFLDGHYLETIYHWSFKKLIYRHQKEI